MSIAAYQGVCPTCRHDHSADVLARTTRETADHAELVRLAEAATPGPWHAAGGYLTVRDPDSRSFSSTIYHLDEMGQKGPSLPYQAVPFAKPSDAAFIAAANPDTVLSLLSEIAALRGDLTETRVAADLLASSLRADLRQAERQRDELRKALEPFAEAAESLDDETRDHDHIWEQPAAMSIDAGHLRTARALIATQGAKQ